MSKDPFQTVRAIFSPKVADYVAARPDYPAALYDRLREIGAMLEGALVADVGAGTGLLSEGLLDRGCRVIAVEPNGEMRAAADAWLGDRSGYRSTGGGAENTSVEDRSVDLVTAAQAFHWFDPEATRIEWLRILKPGGQVAIIWNDRLQGDPLQDGLDDVFEAFGGMKREARVAYDHKARLDTFFHGAGIRLFEFPHEHRLTRPAFHSLAFSRSYMPAPASDEGHRARLRLDALFDAFASGDTVAVRYRTQAYVGRPGEG